MSYDVWLEVDAGGPEPLRVGPDWNCTSNLARMWRAAGIDLQLCDGRDAGGCAEGLEAALVNLRADPDRFRAMDPPNGWGSYDKLVPHLEELLSRWVAAPRAIVRVQH